MPTLDNQRLKTTTLIVCPIQPCTHCGTRVDVSRYEPIQELTCPSCGKLFLVEGQLDRFTLVGLAGHGGTGTVYQANDPQLGRKIALKIVRDDRATDEEVLAQLEGEAQITASLNHPHVLRVFSVGRSQGRFYIAMELVQGGSLDDLLTKYKALPEIQALEIAIQIASGLEAAHQAGLVHRDIKPGNILFSNAQTAKVVDFGLAIFERQATASQGGAIWGTPFYLSPERLEGEAEDFRSDIYSLGTVLFQMLTGRPPFDAGTPQEVALKRLNQAAPSVLTYAPKVSNATAFVVKKMLERDRDLRFQSYKELLESLQFARAELGQTGANKAQRVVLDDSQRRAGMWMTIAFGAFFVIACIVGVVMYRKSRARNEVSPIPVIAVEPVKPLPPAPPPPKIDPAPVIAKTTAAKTVPIVASTPATAGIQPGVYRIKNRRTGQYIDVAAFNSNLDAAIKTWPSGSGPNQRWVARPTGSGWQLIALHSCKALEVVGGSKDDNAQIRQAVLSSKDAQLWRLEPVDGGYHRLVAQCSGKALTVLDAKVSSSGPIGQRSVSNSHEQQWKLEAHGGMPEDLDAIIHGRSLGNPPAAVSAQPATDPKGTAFLPISLRDVANCDSRIGNFSDPKKIQDTINPQITGWVNVAGVTFEVPDVKKSATGKNLLILKGGRGQAIEYTNKVEIPLPEAPRLTKLHFLSGVGGWGYPWDKSDPHLGVIAAQVTVIRKGGSREVLVLRNGVEFADYNMRHEVPGSAYVENFTPANRQLRYFSKALKGSEPVEKIVVESFGTHIAPIFVALTGELAK